MPAFLIGVMIGLIVLKVFGPRALAGVGGAILGTGFFLIFYIVACIIDPAAMSFHNLGLVALTGMVMGGVYAAATF